MKSGQARLLVPLVFCSGWCALVYQTGWMRELRLVFGASTYATAAVLAIFMGGLGAGSAVLGRRADRHSSPLRLYGLLELGIATGALLSPLLFAAIRAWYLATGGTPAMGQPLALAVRLALSTVAFGVPAFLMGGTLPAAAREGEPHAGGYRRATALLYGVNSLGALCGVVATTFFLLERFGTRATVVSAAVLNFAIGMTAILAASRQGNSGGVQRPDPGATDAPRPRRRGLPAAPGLVFAAAALTGFVFFLMEIVWYRMLSPLLGGTTYSFGLILAVALAGIGSGGALASLQGRVRPSIRLFAATCGLEALGIALAFGLGDRVAILARNLRPGADAGLLLFATGWALVCAIVVFPGALVAGYQFPLLISLLGRGGRRVGRHTGAVYLWNTGGAIAGSLVGGFGLLPALGALGCWRLAVLILGALCATAAVISYRRERQRVMLVVAFGSAAAGTLLIGAEGPSAAWRHSAIGAGLTARTAKTLDTRRWINETRFAIAWEKDGVESTVGLNRVDGLTFIVNGKADGNAKFDAGTQVMAPLVGAILHPEPRKAMVIGLGTGSSAGWLAAVPSMTRVDVAELEPAVLEVARRCAPVNRDVLSNPRVRIVLGDARELLMTSRERYDLIFSEPSNPYRAGVAGLFTLEFYRAAAARLAPGGMFSQWVQSYGIDADTVGRIAATLASVFGNVELWQTTPADLLFVCSAGPKDYSIPALAARVSAEPFRSALRAGWGLEGLEGFLSGFFASDAFARHALLQWGPGELNTDDRSPVEFSFARSLGKNELSLDLFRQRTWARGAHRPAVRDGEVDWPRVDADRLLTFAWQPGGSIKPGTPPGSIYKAYQDGNLAAVLGAWEQGAWNPVPLFENLMLAEALAQAGDSRVLPLLPKIASAWPGSATALEALFFQRVGEPERALASLERAFMAFRTDPWNSSAVLKRSVALSWEMAEANPRIAERLFDLLAEPFSVNIADWDRLFMRVRLSGLLDCRHAEQAFAAFEPNVPLFEDFLRHRLNCYAERGNPLTARARRDMEMYLEEGGSGRGRSRSPAP